MASIGAARGSHLLALSIVIAWVAVAFASGQPLWSKQPSKLLLAFGAVDGSVFQTQEWWRLVTSQWLHVRGPHMLFNAALVAVAGMYLEVSAGFVRVLTLYLLGGALAMLASVVVYPELVSSGASQAMLALCGAALVQPLFSRRLGTNWWLIAFGTLGQLGLDLFVSSAHTIKAGHVAGLLIGFAAASFSNRNRGQES